MSGIRVAIDIGGIFTDVSAYDPATGALRAAKTPSTPADLAARVLSGLAGVAPDLAEVASYSQGTTAGLNAFPRRFEDPLRLANLTAEMESRGFDEQTITDVMGANWIRLIEAVWTDLDE
jgi:N-methylhydantoinase A/oxoprolinase/acetone carboxylase beta subunit